LRVITIHRRSAPGSGHRAARQEQDDGVKAESAILWELFAGKVPGEPTLRSGRYSEDLKTKQHGTPASQSLRQSPGLAAPAEPTKCWNSDEEILVVKASCGDRGEPSGFEHRAHAPRREEADVRIAPRLFDGPIVPTGMPATQKGQIEPTAPVSDVWDRNDIAPACSKHAASFRGAVQGREEMLEHLAAHDDIERSIVERQCRCVLDYLCVESPLACQRDRLFGNVDTLIPRGSVLAEVPDLAAVSAADIEDGVRRMDVLLEYRQKCAVCFVPDGEESAGGPVLVVVRARRGGRHHAEDMINRGERLRPPQSARFARGSAWARAQFQQQLAALARPSAGGARERQDPRDISS
jgi:hypothetical protein